MSSAASTILQIWFGFGVDLMPRLYPRISFGVGGSNLVSVHTSEAASPLDLANFGAKIDQIASPPESNWQRTYRKQADSSSSFVMYMPDHLAFMVEISSAYQESETTHTDAEQEFSYSWNAWL